MTKNADGTTITNNSPIEVTGHNIDKEGVTGSYIQKTF